MTTFITRLDAPGDGPRLAVKDIIDVVGVPTTAGSRAVERSAQPAPVDASCLAGARAAGARLVGKTNLHELAMVPIGTNPWFGNPVNPLDPGLIPGGSSSGSAVAVATDEADVAFGSDTGASIRAPAACCGIVGLKTTYGRIPLDGVWPLAPSFDTVGPMATTVAGVTLGMQLLEPGFSPRPEPAGTIGRLRTAGNPQIEAAVDASLHSAEFDVVPLDWDDLEPGSDIFAAIFASEIWDVDHELVEANPDAVGADIRQLMTLADDFRQGVLQARERLATWRRSLLGLFDQVELLALPTLPIFPPRLAEVNPDSLLPIVLEIVRYLSLFNAAGVPCSAQPVPVRGSALPASLQLVGPHGGEDLLIASAARVEAATS